MNITSLLVASCLAVFAAANSADRERDTVISAGPVVIKNGAMEDAAIDANGFAVELASLENLGNVVEDAASIDAIGKVFEVGAIDADERPGKVRAYLRGDTGTSPEAAPDDAVAVEKEEEGEGDGAQSGPTPPPVAPPTLPPRVDDNCDGNCDGCMLVDENGEEIVPSCVDDMACAGTDNATIYPRSCRGSSACRNSTLTLIGAKSCNANNACQFFSGATIGAGSCNADGACRLATGTIGAGSCNADNACLGRTGGVGYNSCNNAEACVGGSGNIEGTIGNNACNGEGSCNGASGTIGKNACHGEGSCIDFPHDCGAIPNDCPSACAFLMRKCEVLPETDKFNTDECQIYLKSLHFCLLLSHGEM